MRTGVPFPPHRDLATLKSAVSLETALHHYGLTTALKRRGHKLVGPCPLHSGADNPTAFLADCRRQLWYCFTRCHGGDVISLIRCVEGIDYPQVAQRLADLAGRSIPASSHHHPPFQPYTRRLRLREHAPFFQAMDLHPHTLGTFEAGFWPHSYGFLQDCVAVRLHSPQGKPLGYAGRRLHHLSRGKWILPRSFPKSTFLFNAHRLPRSLPHPLLLVEGAWGVLKLTQVGYPAVVALFGLDISPFQVHYITRLRTPVLVLTDGDDPGRRAGPRLTRILGPSARFVPLPPDRDPEDLTPTQIHTLLKPFFPNPMRTTPGRIHE